MKFSLKLFIFISVFQVFSVYPQQNFIHQTEYWKYTYALDLFEKEKYTDAAHCFNNLVNDPFASKEIQENASFYSAISNVRLFQKDADEGLKSFIYNYPQSIHTQKAYVELANYYYIKQKWEEALFYFQKTDLNKVEKEDKPMFTFKTGYAYFMLKDYNKAGNYFYQLLNQEHDYSSPAAYYFAHISYENKDYAAALVNFQKIEHDPKFNFIAPYYIAHIYFIQSKHKELIEYIEDKIDVLVPERKTEMYRMLGESYYQLEDYNNAIHYLKMVKKYNREERYHLAYALYKNKEYSEAIDYFNLALVDKDSIDQFIYYHLADCYLQLNQKKLAFQSFSKAHELSYDLSIQEDALFSIAKLSYETSFDPYQETVLHLTKFMIKYPNSPKYQEAKKYLLNIFLITNNYKLAVDELEKMELSSPEFQEAYQKVAFNYAVEQYQVKNYDASIVYFQKSQKYSIEKYIHTLSTYWIAECYYQKKEYDKAIEKYTDFSYKPGAIILSELPVSYYNVGYSYFHKKEYDSSLEWFRKFTVSNDVEDQNMLNDAYLKIADIYYLKKELDVSLEYYTKALQIAKVKADYALYQSAIIYGLQANKKKKQEILQQLLSPHTNSTYIPEASYQIALLNYEKNKFNEAVKMLDEIILKYPNSAVFQKAMLQKAQIFYNNSQYDKALEAYKKYIQNFPNYHDAQLPLQQIKKIYTETNKLAEYTSYISTLQFVNFTKASIDSTAYETAYFQYIDAKYDNAIKGFTDYINDVDKKVYPGIFKTQSYFYRAESYFINSDYPKALLDYLKVIEEPTNVYSEKSLLKASRILFANQMYSEALKLYIQLEEIGEYQDNIWEAKMGQLQCHFKLENYDAVTHQSNKLLLDFKGSEQEKIEVIYSSAYAALKNNNLPIAFDQFLKVSIYTTSVYYSEAMYYLAWIHYTKNEYKEAEVKINELLNGDIVNKHWMAKALILLGDVYFAQKDYLQARFTLQSVMDNHDDKSITDIAQQKLKEVVQEEDKVKQSNQKQEVLPEIKLEETPEGNMDFDDDL